MRGGRAETVSSLLFEDLWISNLERLGSRLVDFAFLAGVAPFSSSFLANTAPSSTSLPARPPRLLCSDLPLGAPRRSAPALGAGELAFPPHQIWRLLGHRRWRREAFALLHLRVEVGASSFTRWWSLVSDRQLPCTKGETSCG